MKFNATPWSTILRARSGDAEDVSRALETLCSQYWQPLYVYSRAKNLSREDAEDAVQGFFCSILEKDYFGKLERERGQFRSFLITSFNRFLINEWKSSTRKKRRPSAGLIPMESDAMEFDIHALATRPANPEEAYEREWALVVIERALNEVRQHYIRENQVALYEALRGYIDAEAERMPYQSISEELAMTEYAVKSALYRLRGRFREALRAEIRRLVDHPEDDQSVDEEIRHLLNALSR